MNIEERILVLESQLKLVETYSVAGFWQAMDRVYDLSLPARDLKCIVCDYSNQYDKFQVYTDVCVFGGGKLERYQCPKCDTIFGPQKYLDLSEAFVNADYNLLYSRYSESNNTENELRTFESLHAPAGSVHLNWGCGAWSESIPKLRGAGFDVWGYEPSALEIRDHIVNARGAISATFDGIFSNNVIEHFRDPIAQFNDFKSLLKPGASMAHASPCYEYRYSFSRFHTLFLLGRAPHILAEKTGFTARRAADDGEYINYVYSLR